MSQFVDNLVEGKHAFEDFGNVGQMILKDLMKTMLMMAAMNPLKNALFGTNLPVMGGGAGIGGLLGGFFGGGGSGPMDISAGSIGGTGGLFAGGGIMTKDGPKALRRYSGGGIAHGRQFAEFGEASVPEAYVPIPNGRIPVELGGGAGGNVSVHIHEAPGTKATVAHSRNPDGSPRIDVSIKKLALDGLMEDLQGGGPVAQTFERRYGLNRAAGMVG
jgi:hypothetical protein